jgi:RecJ-like exonuclease
LIFDQVIRSSAFWSSGLSVAGFIQVRGMDDTKTPGDEVPAGTPQSGEAPCRRCKGAGRIGEETCPDCGGTGKVVVLVGDA